MSGVRTCNEQARAAYRGNRRFGERLARHLCPLGGIDLIVTSRNELKAQLLASRLIQTQMGPDMLAAARDIPEATAFDGMVVTL